MRANVFGREAAGGQGSGRQGSGKARLAAVGAVACLTATVAACSSAGTANENSAAPASPRQAVLLAAHSAAKVSTFSGTISMHGTFSTGGTSQAINMSGTMAGQLRPSLAFDANISTLSAAGQNIGPMGEILTSKALYLKLGVLTQQLHTSKPWIEIPLSALSAKSGINYFSSLLSEAQNSSPVTQTQLLADAHSVKKVGTSMIDGVAVTEYSGTITMAKAITALPAKARAALEKEIAATGIKTASFTVWLDSQHQMKREIITERGTAVSETITVTMTSENQPVAITPPAASQVTTLPASVLSGS